MTTQTDELDAGAQNCSECGGEIDVSADERFCSACGLVVEQSRIDHGPEWRSFTPEETDQRRRTGPARTVARHDNGLGTVLEGSRDSNGSVIHGRRARRLSRLKKWHSRSKTGDKKSYNCIRGLKETRRLVSTLGRGFETRDRACRIFRDAHDADLAKGRSLEWLPAASVHAALRLSGVMALPDEIADLTDYNERQIVTLGLSVARKTDNGMPVITPAEHVPRIVSEIEAGDDVRKRAMDLAISAVDEGIANGRNPSGVAGACVRVASNERITQSRVAEVAGVARATIRHRERELDDLE
jgi:transcription initiation factor TFIIB